jgi:GNAT superfamily N-acetyltransferase
VSWYRRKGIWPWFEVGPAEGADALLDALAAEGAWPVGFVHVSAGEPQPVDETPPEGVAVEPVDGDSVGMFAETLMAGRGVDAERLKAAAADLERWHQIPGMFPLLVRAEGVPAGAAVLFVRDGVGLLADSATLVEHRGRGVGTAGLNARVHLAADLGCYVLAGASEFGSATHLDFQRAGLVGGYTRALLHLGG